jgi:hypothetical protein
MLKYNGEHPAKNSPPWVDAGYEFWFCDPHKLVTNMLSNSEFEGEMDYVPYQSLQQVMRNVFENFMLGDWTWMQVVSLISSTLLLVLLLASIIGQDCSRSFNSQGHICSNYSGK